jgi:hypothetical protein
MENAADSSLEGALRLLQREGFCLWVGAGVSVHLGAVGGSVIPGWKALVEELEKSAGLQPPKFETDFPSRIEVCLRKLNRNTFQSQLRSTILHRLAQAIVEGQDTHKTNVPEQARELAHLGSLANPIVNFNIEMLTSNAIAAPGGFWRPLPFQSPGAARSSQTNGDGKRFERHVYHPHGIIDLSGLCVMAASEYRLMQGTLALQLATHAAFGLNLAIVGMSLEDAYLREQVELFREQIKSIFFFTANPPVDSIAEWSWRNGIRTVVAPWDRFWKAVATELPGPNELDLHLAWLSVLLAACSSSGTPTANGINVLINELDAKPEELDRWISEAKLKGEKVELRPGLPQFPNTPDSVCQFVRNTAKMTRAKRS